MAEEVKSIISIDINTGDGSAELKSLAAQVNAFTLSLNRTNAEHNKFAKAFAKDAQMAIANTRLFTAETIKLASAASTLDKSLSKGKSSLGQFFSAKFNKDSAAAAEVMALAAERAKRLQTQFIATSSSARGMQNALAVAPLSAFANETAVAAQKAEIMSTMFKQGTTQLINFGKNVQWAGRQLMVGFTVPLTIFGNTAGKTFIELEKQVVSFKKVYGDLFTTPTELQNNIDSVTKLAEEYTKYGIAAKDTLSLAAQAAAAGRRNGDLTDAVTQSTRLATLGQMDQNSALETTISLQSAFRLSGKDLADTINFLNMVENQTVVSLQDISTAIPKVAPVIQGLGGDVKDLTVFLAAMQEGGVDAAEGANALKSGLASLINPTKQAQQMLAGFGINLDAIIQANKGDLMGTVMAFSKALQGLDQFSRQQALEQVFGKFQYAKLGALFDNITRNGSQASQVMETLGYSTEQLAATADKELKTIEQSLGVQLTAAVEKFKLAIAPIGELFVKISIPIINFLTKIVDKFNGLSDGQKQFAAIAALIVGVVIPAGTMFLGLLLNLVGTLAKITQGFSAFAKGFITGGPIGAVKALTQSVKYMSLSEMDASMAAQQLAGATQLANAALLEQASAAGIAEGAIFGLTDAYITLARVQQSQAMNNPGFTAASRAATAARGIKTGKIIKRSGGGSVPGSGNTDTVPAMLTPGEFVINKKATANNLPLLKSINSGTLEGFNSGGYKKYDKKQVDALRKRFINIFINPDKNDPQRQQKITDRFYRRMSVNQKRYEKNNNISQTGQSNKSLIKTLGADLVFRNKKAESMATQRNKAAKAQGRNEYLSQNTLLFKREINQQAAARDNSRYRGQEGNYGVDPDDIIESILNPSLTKNGKTISYDPFIQYRSVADAKGLDFNEKEFKEVIVGKIKGLKEEAAKNGKNLRLVDRKALDNGRFKNDESIEYVAIQDIYDDKVVSTLGKDLYREMLKVGSSTTSSANANRGGGGGSTHAVVGEERKALSEKYPGITRDPLVKSYMTVGKEYRAKLAEELGISAKEMGTLLQMTHMMNSGGSVPGSGNTDTVPTMLTPGEFVINKKATAQNRNLLEAINNGQVRGYSIGGMISAAKVAGTKFAGSKIGSKVVGNSGAIRGLVGTAGMMSGDPTIMLASMVAPYLAGPAKTAGKALLKLGAPTLGAAGAFAALGFAAYKLNKQVSAAEKAGGEFTKAMYGTAKTTENIAKAFGRQTFAQAARISAAEKAGGQTISQEAQQQSSGFMQSEAGQQMLKDVNTVKLAGGSTIEAVRNQLSSAIIAGAINTEEARAIAVEIGTALKDERIGVGVSAEITRLMGPQGENLLENILTINAEISPKIDKVGLEKEAQSAYNKLNFGQKLVQAFQGDKFKENYKLQEVMDQSVAILQRELEARQLLTIAYQEGTIALDEYNKKKSELQTSSQNSQNAMAQTVGFKDMNDLVQQSKGTTYNQYQENPITRQQEIVSSQTSFDSQQRKAQKMMNQYKVMYQSMLDENKLYTEDYKKEVMGQLNEVGGTIFKDLTSGRVSEIDIPIVVSMTSRGVPYEEVMKSIEQIQLLRKYPDIEKNIDFKTTDPKIIDSLYNKMTELEVAAKKGPLTKEVIVNVVGSDQIDSNIMKLINKLPTAISIPIILDIAAKGMIQTNGKEKQNPLEIGKTLVNNLTNRLSSASTDAAKTAAAGSALTTGGGGGGGKSFKDTVKDLVKDLVNRFDLVEKRLGIESKSYEDLIKVKQRENELNQRSIDINQRALDEVSKKEEAVNSAYDKRIQLLDEVTSSNDRLRQSEQSRISLATALAQGNIADAAQVMADMTANNSAYQVEDARKALELQREESLKGIKVNVNGILMSRKDIEVSIADLQDRIYNRNLEIQKSQDDLYAIELKREANAREREKVETRLYLISQRQYIQDLNKKKVLKSLTASEKQDLASYTENFKAMLSQYNLTFGENLPGLMYGGSVKKFAFGDVVPGNGNTDRVPALLTPGEFVVKKSVAQAYMPLLESLNSGVFPSLAGPSYNVPSSNVSTASMAGAGASTMYNNEYNINVNVAGTNASPDEIANVVMARLSQTNTGNIRGIRY